MKYLTIALLISVLAVIHAVKGKPVNLQMRIYIFRLPIPLEAGEL